MSGKRKTSKQLADAGTRCCTGSNHGTQRDCAKTSGSYNCDTNQHRTCAEGEPSQ
ncbi:hypothetical protein D3C75_1243880 [compost metagenome]